MDAILPISSKQGPFYQIWNAQPSPANFIETQKLMIMKGGGGEGGLVNGRDPFLAKKSGKKWIFPSFGENTNLLAKICTKENIFAQIPFFGQNIQSIDVFFWQWQFRLAKPPSAQKLWNFRCLYVQCVCLLTNIAVVLITIFDLIAGRGRQTGQMSRKYCRRWNIQILVENMSDIRQQLISMQSVSCVTNGQSM